MYSLNAQNISYNIYTEQSFRLNTFFMYVTETISHAYDPQSH